MSTQIITIIGNIGSGKSSALPIVAHHLQAQTIEADNLFQTTDPFAKEYLLDMQRWAFTNELWLTVQRAKLIAAEIKRSRSKTVLIDSGLLMSWVYTYTHFTAGRLSQAEWSFYCELYESNSASVLGNSSIIFLNYSIPTLLKRIEMRGRAYELESSIPRCSASWVAISKGMKGKLSLPFSTVNAHYGVEWIGVRTPKAIS